MSQTNKVKVLMQATSQSVQDMMNVENKSHRKEARQSVITLITSRRVR